MFPPDVVDHLWMHRAIRWLIHTRPIYRFAHALVRDTVVLEDKANLDG